MNCSKHPKYDGSAGPFDFGPDCLECWQLWFMRRHSMSVSSSIDNLDSLCRVMINSLRKLEQRVDDIERCARIWP